jgi:hypothetical protein
VAADPVADDEFAEDELAEAAAGGAVDGLAALAAPEVACWSACCCISLWRVSGAALIAVK